MRPTCVVLSLLLFVLAAGCGRRFEFAEDEDLAATAAQARDDAVAAQQAGDPEAARWAADWAEAAVEEARTRADRAAEADRPAADRAVREVLALAREAVKFAETAEEEADVADKLGGLRGRSYARARAASLKAIYMGLSLGAKHAGDMGYAALNAQQRDLADRALEAAGAPRLPDGSPDWDAAARTLAAQADDPPRENNYLLAVCFACLKQDRLALYEAAPLDPADVTSPGEKLKCHIIRGVVFMLNGYSRLAMRDLQAALVLIEDLDAERLDPELRGCLHLGMAVLHGLNHDYEACDREVMRATQLWPNNPVGTILTGEVMVAQGEYVKAAVTLEDLLCDLDAEADPEIVRLVQERARQIRDDEVEAAPLFHDPAFIRRLQMVNLTRAARTSETAKKLTAYLDRARAFGADLLGRIPGVGGDDAEP